MATWKRLASLPQSAPQSISLAYTSTGSSPSLLPCPPPIPPPASSLPPFPHPLIPSPRSQDPTTPPPLNPIKTRPTPRTQAPKPSPATPYTAYNISTAEGADSALFLQSDQREVSCQLWLVSKRRAGEALVRLCNATPFLPVGLEYGVGFYCGIGGHAPACLPVLSSFGASDSFGET